MSLVSIIVPNFNHAKFLAKRIDSILGQTYQNFELIILDDASTDDSKAIIDFYACQSKVSKIEYNTTNSGSAFAQWIKGIELASGDFIWIAESDDFCEPTFLYEIMEAFKVNSKLGLVYTGTYAIDANENKLWHSPIHDSLRVWEGKSFVNQKMIFGNSIFNASMAVFKKDCLGSIPTELVSYKFCGDWLFWINLALNCEVAYVGKPLNYFRNHDKDVSGKSYQQGLYFSEYENLLNWALAKSIISKKTQRFALWRMLPLIPKQVENEELKRKIFLEYKRNLFFWEQFYWEIDKNFFSPMRFRIKKMLG